MFKISIFYFIVSLFIGIGVLYVIHPAPEIVNNYPDVDSLSKMVYKDDVGRCYSYTKEKKITC